MRRITTSIVALIVCFPASLRAEGETGALVAICDQAAASPFDTNRPAGVAGVAADKIDPKIAIPACEAAAKVAPNDPRTMFQLGRAYGSAKAYESARVQYEKADAAGYALATNNLASFYMDGLGMAVDTRRALSLFEKAANGGVAIAMKSLGDAYLSGKRITEDATTARRWYEKAADVGSSDAMYNLGWLNQKGKGGPQNYVEARRWYERAAALGDIEAMGSLGYFYQDGLGVEKNRALAKEWYRKAIAAGNTSRIIAANLRDLDRPASSRRSSGGRTYSSGRGTGDSGWKRGYPPGYSPYPARREYGLGWTGAPCYVPGTPGC